MTMKARDLVTLDGGSRTAATIILEGLPKNIDVTSVTGQCRDPGYRYGGPSLHVRSQLTAVPTHYGNRTEREGFGPPFLFGTIGNRGPPPGTQVA